MTMHYTLSAWETTYPGGRSCECDRDCYSVSERATALAWLMGRWRKQLNAAVDLDEADDDTLKLLEREAEEVVQAIEDWRRERDSGVGDPQTS